MRQMNKPEMEVIRFAQNDIVVASSGRLMSQSITLTRFSGGTPKDGVVQYNGTSYPITSSDDVSTFLSALRNNGIKNAGISNGKNTQSLRNTIGKEVTRGVEGDWNGTYDYDPFAIWNNGDIDLFGVFIRQ